MRLTQNFRAIENAADLWFHHILPVGAWGGLAMGTLFLTRETDPAAPISTLTVLTALLMLFAGPRRRREHLHPGAVWTALAILNITWIWGCQAVRS